ncbi:MAG: glycosyltransferase family 1 protein [Candidatus Moranbacteria bacterium]|nr:glycosyltransferase family 1 protein [Candidatus Moranbacteria bacterium]
MKIAVNAADLDHSRIDGTRIYIQNLLRNFGHLNKNDRFLIYHKSKFNPQLRFPIFENYEIIQKPFPFWWTQTRFAWEMLRTKPDILFMPMHSLPYLRSKKIKTVVTIHDLAFKFFPDHFPKKDLRRLNFFTDHAVENADKLITISNSTKNDLLKIYPKINADKIKVIYHGYDKGLFNKNISREQILKINTKYKIQNTKYIIFVGTIQPRKNIETLLEAFEILRKKEKYKDLGLVIAGCSGWLAENIVAKIKKTPGALMTGKFETEDLPALIAGAEVFVLPSLYEGFGLPALEAMACGTPVAVADNSSLYEVVEDAGLLFDPNSGQKIADALLEILENEKMRNSLREKGLERAEYFSWEKCAKETLEWIEM